MIVLHGIAQDEQFLPALVRGPGPGHRLRATAADDHRRAGRQRSRPASFLSPGSFYLNTRAGRFEDYIVQDVWGFLLDELPDPPGARVARPGRGVDGRVRGVQPRIQALRAVQGPRRHHAAAEPAVRGLPRPLHGRISTRTAPACGTASSRSSRSPGSTASSRSASGGWRVPLFRRDRGAMQKIAAENPIEMLDAYDVRPGQFDMFVGYGGRDEFNIDAQVESFLLRRPAAWPRRRRGLRPAGPPHAGDRLAAVSRPSSRWLGPLLRGTTKPHLTRLSAAVTTPKAPVLEREKSRRGPLMTRCGLLCFERRWGRSSIG